MVGAAAPPDDAVMERRLYREPEDRRLAGVCSGLADFLGLDPTVVRLLAVSLVLLAGAGLVLYVVAAVVIPERPASVVRVRTEHFSTTDVTTPPMLALLVLALSLVVVLDRDWFPGPVVGVTLLAVGVWLLAKNSGGSSSTGSGERATVTAGAASEGEISPPVAEEASPTDPQGEVPPPVPPWGFGVVTVVVLTVAVVGLAQFALNGWIDLDVGTVLGGGLIVAGLILVVGAWWGRARALIGLGMPLLLVILVAHLIDVPLDAEADDRTVVIDSADELEGRYELLAGHLTVDLRELPASVLRQNDLDPLEATVGIGEMTVLVPERATASIDADVRLGQLTVTPNGIEEEGFRMHRDVRIEGDEGAGQLGLQIRLGIGDLEVARD